MEWQPIETCPRGFSNTVLFSNGKEVHKGYISEDGSYFFQDVEPNTAVLIPTRWMPLPNP